MIVPRHILMLGACLLVGPIVRADDVGFVDCHAHAERTYVLAKGAKTSQAVTSLSCGEQFAVLLDGEVFSRIRTRDGKIGYIYSYLISRGDVPTQSASPATLSLHASNVSGEVYVDGKYVGAAPSTITVKPGDHFVVIEKDNAAVRTRKLTLASGDSVTIDTSVESQESAPSRPSPATPATDSYDKTSNTQNQRIRAKDIPAGSIRAIAYRVVPQQHTSYIQSGQASSNTTCYGQGQWSNYGSMTNVNATTNCDTSYSSPTQIPLTWQFADVYIFVETSDQRLLIGCRAKWRWSGCAPLVPGDLFHIERNGSEIWVTGSKNGSTESRVKYSILEVSPRQ